MATNTDDRGQTTLDYAIGISTFLLAVGFVVLFVPGMFQPFTGSQDVADPVVSDRVADQLTTNLLVESSDEPYVLNETCTARFAQMINGSAFSPLPSLGCRFDESASPQTLTNVLGMDRFVNLNVTLERNFTGDSDFEVVTYNDSVPLVNEGGGGWDYRLGDRAPLDSGSVTSARRTVLIGNTEYRLVVRTW